MAALSDLPALYPTTYINGLILKIVIIIVENLTSPTKWNELKFSDQTELHKNSKVNARMYN